jgi:hypothetical protein
VLSLPQSRAYGRQLLAQLGQLCLCLCVLGRGRGPDGDQLCRHLVKCVCPVRQLLLSDGEGGVLLLGEGGSFTCCGVGLQPLRLGLTLGLLGAADSGGCGGDLCGGLNRH